MFLLNGMSHKPCLILNIDYTPLGLISWQRAYCLYYKQSPNIEILSFYEDDRLVGPMNRTYKMPAVIKTNKYFKIYNQQVNFSRKNLFLRDNYTCQYCYKQFDGNKLTYDHVIPKSVWNKNRGNPTCWTNIVTACVSCNRKKSNRTPSQASMVLKINPYVPQKTYKYLHIPTWLSNIKDDIPSEWKPYIKETTNYE